MCVLPFSVPFVLGGWASPKVSFWRCLFTAPDCSASLVISHRCSVICVLRKDWWAKGVIDRVEPAWFPLHLVVEMWFVL